MVKRVSFAIYRCRPTPEQMVFDRAFVNREVPTNEVPEIIDEYDCVGVYEVEGSFEIGEDERTRLVIAGERFDAQAVYEDKAGKHVYIRWQDNEDEWENPREETPR